MRYQAHPGPTLHVLFDAMHEFPHGFPVVQYMYLFERRLK